MNAPIKCRIFGHKFSTVWRKRVNRAIMFRACDRCTHQQTRELTQAEKDHYEQQAVYRRARSEAP